MQMIPCEVILEQEVMDGKKFETKQIIQRCILFGFGVKTITITEGKLKGEIANVTTALIQVIGENVIREVPIATLKMQDVIVQEKSNLLIPNRQTH